MQKGAICAENHRAFRLWLALGWCWVGAFGCVGVTSISGGQPESELRGAGTRDAGVGDIGARDGRSADGNSCQPILPIAPSLAPGATGQPSRELIAGGTPDYASIAALPADPFCSDDSYDDIAFCTNRANPPAPSLTRRVGLSRPHDLSDSVSPYLAGGRENGDYEGETYNFVCQQGTVNGAVRSCFIRDTEASEFTRCARGDTPIGASASCPSGHHCYYSIFSSTTVRCDSDNGAPPANESCPGLTHVVADCGQTPANIPRTAARAGERVIGPVARTSNDGRLMINPGYRGWPQVSVLRPEAVTADHTLGSNRSAVSRTNSVDMNTMIWFNPIDTGFRVRGATGVTDANAEVRQLHIVADLSHSLLCEASSSSFQADGRIRNPVPCSARYGDFAYDGVSASASELETRHGVCYRVTFLSTPVENGHWELRSAPVTVFVPNAYRVTTEQGMWVYPDNPKQAFDQAPTNGSIALPDFAEYDVGRMFPWTSLTASGVPNDLTTYVTSGSLDTGNALPINARCYQKTGGDFVPAAQPPAWCEFMYNQHRSSRFYFDVNRDAVADRAPNGNGLAVWNGESSQRNLFEGATTGDGRLFILNDNNGLFYSTNSVGACRADGFNSFLPLSLMPVDSEMLSRNYGIARASHGRPFRDSTGQSIPFGSYQRFAYGWIDRAGSNLLLATFNEERDVYRAQTMRRVPTDARLGTPTITPVLTDEGKADLSEVPERRDHLNTRAGHHVAVLGAWTQGRLINLDNELNASDFGGTGWFGTAPGLGSIPYRHEFELPLYRDRSLRFVPVGSTMINSWENRLNYLDAWRPHLPFDVAWTVSSANQTMSEIVFDDYLDERAFAVVHMNAAVHVDDTPAQRAPGGASRMVIDDGFVPDGNYWDDPNYIFNTNPTRIGQGGVAVLQNAAPASSLSHVLLFGGARIEPVALGGVLGRGIFLDGRNDYLQMDYPDCAQRDWYLGMWIEPQPEAANANTIRELFHFNDDSFVGLKATASGFNLVAYAKNPTQLRELELGDLLQAQRFAHVALRTVIVGDSRVLYFYINGTVVGTIAFQGHARGLTVTGNCGQSSCGANATLRVGAPAFASIPGSNAQVRTFHGWIDELRVYRLRAEDARQTAGFDEQICNFALGTLAAGQRFAPLPARLEALRERFEQQTGRPVSQVCEQLILEPFDEPFDLARQRNRTDCVAHVHDGVLPAYCVRARLLEMPTLTANAARPDSSSTSFCLSCHRETSPIAGLRVSALVANSQPRYADRRRQPSNPPAVLGLPQHNCVTGPLQLDGTWYGLFRAQNSLPLADGTWTTDQVFDQQSFFEPGPN